MALDPVRLTPTEKSHGKDNFSESITTVLKLKWRKESAQPCLRSP